MTHNLWMLCGALGAVFLFAAADARAQAPLAFDFGAPILRQASLTTESSLLHVTFQPADWPSIHWKPPAGQSWDWNGRSTVAFQVTNPNSYPVQFNVRIDDDPSTDGVHHCHAAEASIDPGKTATYFVEFGEADPKSTMGMNGGPPQPGREGMVAMAGWGAVDPAHIYAFQVFVHQPPAGCALTFSLPRLLPTLSSDALYKGIVDSYGQFTKADWPAKLHAVADFATRRALEEHGLAAAPGVAGRDSYGGWADGPKLPATGFFTTTQRDGRWWLVTPSGHLFLSFGVDTVDMTGSTIVDPRAVMFTGLPEPGDPLARFYGRDDSVRYGPYKSGRTFDFYQANLQRKYGPNFQQPWADTTVARLKSWGFNTLGNWSNVVLEIQGKMPYTATLDVRGSHARIASGSDYWGQMHDPFDPQFAVDCDQSFAATVETVKNDPMCLGWFVDNELSWSGGPVEHGRYGLAYGALAAPPGQPAKQAFVDQLKHKYSDIDALNTAWGTTLSGWADLAAAYPASATPTDAQKADMSAFVYAFARKYFTIVRDSLKKYDPNHLYLGCRFASGYNPDAVRAASEICDVVSCNVYQPTLTDAFLQSYVGFPANPSDLGKPCLIGEFHCGALDRGLFHHGLVGTPNQAARAQIFMNYINSVANNPAFVGAHWFQYVDEPLTGRPYDGENYNIGFVTVTDTPYPEMVAAARQVLANVYARRAQNK